MENKKKKDNNAVGAPLDSLKQNGVEELDDEDVENVAGGFGLNTVNLNIREQVETFFTDKKKEELEKKISKNNQGKYKVI